MSFFNSSSDVDYAYAYGRVSAMQGGLIAERELRNYCAAVSVNEVVASLENTTYGSDISGIVWTPREVSKVEEALNENYARIYHEVLSLIVEKDALQLDMLLKGLWHHRNIKLIIRAITAGVSLKQVKAELNKHVDVDYSRLLEAGQLSELLLLLDEPYASRLRSLGLLDKEDASKGLVESTLDAALVESWFETLTKKELIDYARVFADTINLLTLARCVSVQENAGEYLVSGGMELSRERLLELSQMSVEAVSEALKKTQYSKQFDDGLSALNETGSLSTLENKLQDYLKNHVELEAIQRPLSINSPLSFLVKKRIEVENLRKIIILKSHQIPSEKIQATLKLT